MIFALGTPCASALQLQLFLEPARNHPELFPPRFPLVMTLFHTFILMNLVWTYTVAATTSSKVSPALVFPTQTGTGNTFCGKCKIMRPPRAHHCSKCAHCSSRLDHHCAFLGTCVGARNYKAFCLFLLHASILSAQVAFASYAYWYWGNGEGRERHWTVSLFFWGENVALWIGDVFVAAMLFIHCLLIAINATSMEYKKGAALYFPGGNPIELVLHT